MTKEDTVSIDGRVLNAKRAGLHPMDKNQIEEGTHYEVLAYTDYADVFVPTVVEWENGETDSFRDPAVTKRNKRKSIQMVSRNE